MLPEEYGILTELLRELKQEIQDMDMRINTNLRKIREAEAYVGTLAISESEDFKVFSPRRAETLHKERGNAVLHVRERMRSWRGGRRF